MVSHNLISPSLEDDAKYRQSGFLQKKKKKEKEFYKVLLIKIFNLQTYDRVPMITM